MTTQSYAQPLSLFDLPGPDPYVLPEVGPVTWVVVLLSHNQWCINIEGRVPLPSRRDVVVYVSGDEETAEDICRWLGREWTGNGVWFPGDSRFIRRVLMRACKHNGLRHPWTRRVEAAAVEHDRLREQRRWYGGPCPACGHDECDAVQAA